MKKTFKVSLLFLLLQACNGPIFERSSASLPQRAQDAAAQGEFDTAIDLYHEHISYRRKDPAREEWENPSFYLLFIGDMYLKKAEPQKALDNYQRALDEKVEIELVADRIRSLATWYEEHNQLQDAFNLLENFRAKDPLLFDSALDRVSRKLTAQEDTLRK